MNIFPHTQDRGKETCSTGQTPVDGAAPPPCKDSAAPTSQHMPFPGHRTCAQTDLGLMLAEGERLFAQIAQRITTAVTDARKGGAWRKRTRRALRNRDGDQCCYCHQPMRFPGGQYLGWDEDFASIEHIIPLRDGGSNDLDNLALAHSRCNHAKNEGRPVHPDWIKP